MHPLSKCPWLSDSESAGKPAEESDLGPVAADAGHGSGLACGEPAAGWVATSVEPEVEYTWKFIKATKQSYFQYQASNGRWLMLVGIKSKQYEPHHRLMRRLMSRVMPGHDTGMSCFFTALLPFA